MKTSDYNRRLLKLADHLDTVRNREFDMGAFVHNSWSAKGYNNECGTAACAMGHATNIPAFRKLGLKIEVDVSLPGEPLFSVTLPSGNWGFAAAQELFGLSSDQSVDLFGSHHRWKTPKQVAQMIRKFVARRSGK